MRMAAFRVQLLAGKGASARGRGLRAGWARDRVAGGAAKQCGGSETAAAIKAACAQKVSRQPIVEISN